MPEQNSSSTKHKPGPCNGRKYLVTGGTRGLGKAIVTELYIQGATIFVLSKNPDNLQALKEEFPLISTICVDLSDWEETRKKVEEMETVDCLINNAAVTYLSNFMNTTKDMLDNLYKTNVGGVFNVSQIMAKKMIESGMGGSIVNVSSSTARMPYPACMAYASFKAALEMMTKTMAVELGPHKILVNSVCPALMETDMYLDERKKAVEAGHPVSEHEAYMTNKTPTRTFYMPLGEVVNAVLFFGSGKNLQITGESLLVDGGLAHAF